MIWSPGRRIWTPPGFDARIVGGSIIDFENIPSAGGSGGGGSFPLFLTDNFNGTNGTNITSHSPDVGGAWSNVNSAFAHIESVLNGAGVAVATNSAGTHWYSNAATTVTSHCRAMMIVTIANPRDDVYVYINLQSTTILYSAGYNANTQKWQINQGGTILATSAVIPDQAGLTKTIEVQYDGTNVTMLVDSVQVLQAAALSDIGVGSPAVYLGFGTWATAAPSITYVEAARLA